MMVIPEAAVEAVEARIRTMLLRVESGGDALGIAVAALEAAAPHMIAMVATTIAAGMAAWGGEAERGYVDGFAEGAVELAAKA
jgi:hypothetical protein